MDNRIAKLCQEVAGAQAAEDLLRSYRSFITIPDLGEMAARLPMVQIRDDFDTKLTPEEADSMVELVRSWDRQPILMQLLLSLMLYGIVDKWYEEQGAL